ncbi:probable DNA-directed RNA polymerase I subunit RPA43 [Zingiber officinale]|uniref:DNA-directed RNA polymerase subunit n=1 Tax=Zingiber officinale TaxID=94328 RepID=A0A8J5LPE0_ZINOF|nr:probable DNA-directed RNA polymerase I subunit RPA43 [Zingiber officinale]KAG6524400.1 hypothetical protein ZIOFF_014309 [Zingiber officinale]
MEGLKVAEADLVVYVHPSKSNQVRRAVLRQLSSLLFTHDEIFDGVVLAYEVNIPSKRAKVISGLIPYIGVKIKANLLLFSPKPSMLIGGKVVKLGKESIHVVVLGFSSAAIMLEDIREEFKYKIKHGEGVFASSSHKRHVIKAGSMIRFQVKSFDEEILHISGSLLPSNTGCIQWLSKHGTEDGSYADSSLKTSDIQREMQEEGTLNTTTGDKSPNKTQKHKSKKRTRGDR